MSFNRTFDLLFVITIIAIIAVIELRKKGKICKFILFTIYVNMLVFHYLAITRSEWESDFFKRIYNKLDPSVAS